MSKRVSRYDQLNVIPLGSPKHRSEGAGEYRLRLRKEALISNIGTAKKLINRLPESPETIALESVLDTMEKSIEKF